MRLPFVGGHDHGLVPASTYRLQIRESFPLGEAAALVDYLRDLGVGAVYVSPLLQATAGSDHGYDVVNHRRIDPARGGGDGLERLMSAAHGSGLDLVVDLVPNHAGVADATQNPTWWDVLEHGQAAVHAHWYDIEWTRQPLLLPVLGSDDDVTKLTLERSDRTDSGWELGYYEHRFPVGPATGPADGETPQQVHERQAYRLVDWRRADEEQNYRRFFAVTDLAGLRVEDEAVFTATHETILDHLAATDDDGEPGRGITGLRIDHPDGLADPLGYVKRLRKAAPHAWITVEKILEPGEELPSDWPVAGTTGYDALTEVAQVLTDPAAAEPLTALYQELTGDHRDFHDHVENGKRMIATSILHAEINRLTRLVPDVPGAAEALLELVVPFAVYRYYLPKGKDYLDAAVETAVTRQPSIAEAVEALKPRLYDADDELSLRFAQVTGAVTAKGVEDTTYYRYTRALWLNEVGGDPATVGSELDTFHDKQQRRHKHAAAAMTTLSTHDTKRGEDVRARLTALAELPDEWATAARRLAQLHPVPDPAFGLLLWQTFLGAGFIERERMHAYAEKAMREASDGTSWRTPDEAFEQQVHAAVDAGYDDAEVHAVLASLGEQLQAPGWSNALSQKILQLTMPGVPDVYQGTELWEDSLVDPDNRRAVDYADRRRRLAALDAAGTPPPVDADGAAKLWLVSRVLRARRDRPESFGEYSALRADGAAADHLVVFDRGGAITLATRLPVALGRRGGWGKTTLTLPDGTWRDALTGAKFRGGVRVADALATYPVALYLRDPDDD